MASGEVNPVLADVEAQLHRIHAAVNDGTLDKASVADALRLIHDFVSGRAYEQAPAEPVPVGETEYDAEPDDIPVPDEVADEGEGEEHPHRKKPRKKR